MFSNMNIKNIRKVINIRILTYCQKSKEGEVGGGVEITFILYLFPGMSGFHIVMQDTDSTNRQIPRTIEYIVLPPEKNKTLEIMIA